MQAAIMTNALVLRPIPVRLATSPKGHSMVISSNSGERLPSSSTKAIPLWPPWIGLFVNILLFAFNK